MCAEGCWHIQGVREPLPARRHLPERRARRRSAVRGRSVAGLVTRRCVSCGQLLDTTYQQSAARDSPDAPTAELVAPAPSRARRAVTALPTPRICAPGAWRVTYHVLYWAPDASTAELGAPAGPVPSRPLGYDQVAGFDAFVLSCVRLFGHDQVAGFDAFLLSVGGARPPTTSGRARAGRMP